MVVLRRALLALLCLLFLAGAAGAENDAEKLSRLQEKVAKANQREGVLTSRIASMNGRIRSLRSSVSSAESRLERLEVEVGMHRERLARVEIVYERQAELLEMARRQYETAEHRIAQRLVALYQSEPPPDAVAVMLSASSLSDAVDRLEYLSDISTFDKRMAEEALKVKRRWTTVQERTKRLLDRIEAEANAITMRASEVLHTRDRLASTRDRLRRVRNNQKETLDSVRESKQKWLTEIAAMQAGSAAIAARIRSAGTLSTQTPSAAGLIWPVQGVLTSPYGMRWGRLHEGIDIGAPSGTPIYAAAAATVIYSGWQGGYGNLVVLDHGNGIATAYGHQSQIAVSNGQTVAQGQVIGYVGSTGHSTGPHLHFEVRVNGTPVDPLSYL